MIRVAVGSFESPTLDYALIAPMLVVFGAALVGVLVEAFVPRRVRGPVQPALGLGALVASFAVLVWVTAPEAGATAAEATVAMDKTSVFLQGTVLLLSFVAMLLFAERGVDPSGDAFAPSAASIPGSEGERELVAVGARQTEIWPLAMFSVAGMMLFPAANDLLTMFVALEVLSLPLYLMVGLARRRRLLSQEAAIKYFLLGSFSSAFFLFGSALLFGFAGSIRLGAIHDALGTQVGLDPLLLLGTGMVAVGLLFKVGAVPFHAWVPDVYQGSPTAVTAFMAASTKVAAFGAILRVFYVALGDYSWDWRPMMWVVVVLTLVVGAVLAITQTDIKRMLAYSSVAQVGFILTGVVATNQDGLSSTLFYLVAYGFATIGAFAIVTLVRDAGGEATHLSKWAGLGKRSPLTAGLFALFLLSFAGIPLTSGFIGKFAVFEAAVRGGATPLVIVGVVTSAVAAFFYVRVIVLMFFTEPSPDGATVTVPSVFTSSAIAVAAAATVVLGVLPGPVLDLANEAASLVR
ncbi:MAG TPA: NADH-quinone oxidoreductase subunit NuoN [Actinomycetes bacterium]|nr:NADH-quinone oxidoreductase subunit NuoN [Actinomycetes bacterium]